MGITRMTFVDEGATSPAKTRFATPITREFPVKLRGF
jgi:hypothetical protein